MHMLPYILTPDGQATRWRIDDNKIVAKVAEKLSAETYRYQSIALSKPRHTTDLTERHVDLTSVVHRATFVLMHRQPPEEPATAIAFADQGSLDAYREWFEAWEAEARSYGRFARTRTFPHCEQ